jgi:hypothetical protein
MGLSPSGGPPGTPDGFGTESVSRPPCRSHGAQMRFKPLCAACSMQDYGFDRCDGPSQTRRLQVGKNQNPARTGEGRGLWTASGGSCPTQRGGFFWLKTTDGDWRRRQKIARTSGTIRHRSLAAASDCRTIRSYWRVRCKPPTPRWQEGGDTSGVASASSVHA